MRGRKKPWAGEFILQHQDYIYNPEKDFINQNKTYLEVGMGKGDFIIASCKYSPDINHIGVELNKSVFAIAMKKIVNENLNNIKLLNVAALNLLDYIKLHSINRIYLNFSDPWPKSGYQKRRLVHPIHLEIFEKLLETDGEILFKTDNLKLFEYGLEIFNQRNYEIVFLSYDYQLIEGDFLTEYEKHFRSLNQPIYRCVFKIRKENHHENVE